MSDETLRNLERRFGESGNVDDEAAWLRERARAGEALDWVAYSRLHELDDLDVDAAADYLRWRFQVGELTHEQLELAWALGHGPAWRALDEPNGPTPDLKDGLRGASRLVAARVAYTLGLDLLPYWEKAVPDDPRPARALKCLGDWIQSQSDEARNSCERASADAFPATWEHEAEAGLRHFPALVAWAAAIPAEQDYSTSIGLVWNTLGLLRLPGGLDVKTYVCRVAAGELRFVLSEEGPGKVAGCSS